MTDPRGCVCFIHRGSQTQVPRSSLALRSVGAFTATSRRRDVSGSGETQTDHCSPRPAPGRDRILCVVFFVFLNPAPTRRRSRYETFAPCRCSLGEAGDPLEATGLTPRSPAPGCCCLDFWNVIVFNNVDSSFAAVVVLHISYKSRRFLSLLLSDQTSEPSSAPVLSTGYPQRFRWEPLFLFLVKSMTCTNSTILHNPPPLPLFLQPSSGLLYLIFSQILGIMTVYKPSRISSREKAVFVYLQFP